MNLLSRTMAEARSLLALSRAGAVPLRAPHLLPSMALTTQRLGPFGAAPRLAALRFSGVPAIVDERGQLTYGELERQINRLTNIFRARYAPGQTVGVMCRNHRGPLTVAFAASRAGLNTVWLNTAFAAPQAVEVIGREGVDLLVCDADLAPLVAGLDLDVVVADITRPHDELSALIESGDPEPAPAPARPGRLVLLTSGTTGTPKGAPRLEPRGFTLPGGLLHRMPMRSGGATVIGPPLFHGTGLVMTMLTMATGSTVVLHRQFDAEQMLAGIARHRADAVCAVPVMLQRILALDRETVERHDTSSLRIIFCSGSALPVSVGDEIQSRFGPVLYNLYGSTEVSFVTVATPGIVRDHPTSVGRPLLGARVAVIGDDGVRVPTGEHGRIFVGTLTPFEGYTGGGGKDVVDGLLATGDMGHLDGSGLLYIEGRDDEMIVSGGENLFPGEVEDLLVAHPEILEAAVLGIDDAEFGQRLRAFVVRSPSSSLDVEGVRSHVRDNLARFKVPREVVFVAELPRNATGKVLKRELAQWDVTSMSCAAPAPATIPGVRRA